VHWLRGLSPLRREPGPCLFPLENNSKNVISKIILHRGPCSLEYLLLNSFLAQNKFQKIVSLGTWSFGYVFSKSFSVQK
jgi:hypothetical protein